MYELFDSKGEKVGKFTKDGSWIHLDIDREKYNVRSDMPGPFM